MSDDVVVNDCICLVEAALEFFVGRLQEGESLAGNPILLGQSVQLARGVCQLRFHNC